MGDAVADLSAAYHRLALEHAARRAARVLSAGSGPSELDAGGSAR